MSEWVEAYGEDVGWRIECELDDRREAERAEAWASGRLAHTEECQINRTPPAGWPFDGFSCNCGGVEVG